MEVGKNVENKSESNENVKAKKVVKDGEKRNGNNCKMKLGDRKNCNKVQSRRNDKRFKSSK